MPSADDTIRVLVADDHPMYRSSIARAVSLHPRLALVAEAEDGRVALDRVREHQPDVAVVDLRMPGLDGLQIVEAVRSEGLGTHVVLLSGYLQGEAVYTALQRGASGVLSKAADAEPLTDAILAVARGETVIAPEVQDAVAAAIRARPDGDQAVLTAREREVLGLVADGGSVASIANELQLSQSTIKTHLEHLYRKLGVSERAAAVAEAMRRGLLH